MKKIKVILLVMIVAAMTVALCSCSPTTRLSEIYNEEEVIARAQEVIEVVNTRDYDQVVAIIREDLKSVVKAEDFFEAWDETLERGGAFERYSKVEVSGGYDKDTESDYAIVDLTCKYEKGKITFTVSMDKDLEIIGIYMA